MSDIMCHWLNEELKLSKSVDQKSLAKDFASGFLIGEVLHKYQLQDDFDQFSQSRATNSKLNNFSRMEPTLNLLGVQFDQNVAQAIMSEQHGAATRLLYQLYIVLQKKKKAGLSGVTLEAMRPAAPAKLQGIQTEIYRERLKNLLPRQTDLNLQSVTDQFEQRSKEIDEKMIRLHNEELRKAKQIQEELRYQDIDKLRQASRKRNEIMARIQAAIVQIPKLPANRSLKAIDSQKNMKKKKEAEEVYTDITKFEKQLKKESPVSSIQSPERCAPTKVLSKKSPRTDLSKSEATDEYIRNIQKRLEEDSFAREQREKRRRKMLMEQLKAHETQEDTYREEQLINRLMRQSQQERRIAVQLMHVRHEKEVLWQNRIFREKQYEERRQKDFQDALDREAALLKQEKLDNEDQIQKEIELYDKLAAERAEARYRKHHDMCKEILDQIIDVVTKVGEYRALTNNLIPVKMMRDWKELFLNGIPLYEQASIELLPSEPSPEELLEQEKMTLLDEKDYEEYKTMTGEWIPPEDAGVQGPAANNNILGYVIRRLQELVSPPKPMTPPPAFPPFPIKGCILGKTFSGKSTSLKFLEKTFILQVLSVDTLAQEAIQAFHDNELENEDTETEQEENVKQDELSPRAQLGMAAEKLLKSGKSITDELLTEIIVAAIKRIPENTGWILDGFPLTINQAKLLEKAMTGVDPDKAEEKSKKKKSSTTLVTDVRAVRDPPPPIQALDFAILLDIADTVVLQRASGASGDKSSSTTVQQEDTNEFSTLELKKKEGHEPVRDQIQHRIAGFLDNWPMLEEWFSEKQNILVKVNGEIEEPELLNRMEEVILEEIYKKENKGRKREEQIKEEEKKKEEVPEPAPAPQPETPPPETSQQLEPPAPPAGKKGKRDSKSLNDAKDSSKGNKLKKSESASGKESPKKSGKSDSRGRLPRKKSKSPTPEEAPPSPPPEPTGPPPIQPGSDEWVYVVEPLPQEIPEFLAPYWETVEDTYSKTVKVVLRNLRNEEHTVIYYLHDVRKEYKEYLTRPDHKQEFVSQWQADFNSTAEDLWDQEGIRAELHQRVNDLRDRLWDITDNRKEEAEQERSDIINSGWLPDHMGLLVNHFFTLMQVEVDRFQDTIRLLRDYYNGMGGDMPTETSRDFVRIPLLDLGNAEQPGETEIPKRVPLVDRVPQPAEQTPSKPKIKVPTVKSKDEQVPEKPTMPFESDEKLIIDTWQYAVTAVSNMLAAEVQLQEAEEEKERLLKEMKEKEQQKASKAGSGKGADKNKSKSPNKKKDQTPEPAPQAQAAPTPEESAELEKKTELQKRIQQEFIAALEFEVAATKDRLDLIKSKVLALEQDLMTKADSAYKDMEKWLGARYLAEMANIDQLVNIACHHIESATKIRLELVLKKTDFYIDGDVKVIPDSPAQPCLPLSEAQLNGTLTISQLNRLYPQFLEVAPGGFIPIKQFVDILLSLITMNLGNEILPEVWMNLTVSDVTALAAAFAVNSDVINWRKFLLSAMQPWPYPSVNDLLVTLESFKDIDEAGLGTVTQEQYNKVDLWFSTELSLPATEEGTCTPLPFNRLEFIRQFFFTLFADSKKNPPQLDYVKTLFYFACHDDPFEGFYRALSVVTGKPIKMRKRNTFFLKSLPKIEPAFHLLPKYDENRESFDVDLSPDEAQITLANFIEVFQHGVREKGDNYRFYHEQKEQDTFYKLKELHSGNCNIKLSKRVSNGSKLSLDQKDVGGLLLQLIPHIFEEMGSVDSGPISVSRLLRHPFIQDLMESDQQYKLPDIQGILVKIKQPNEGDHPVDETASAVETDME